MKHEQASDVQSAWMRTAQVRRGRGLIELATSGEIASLGIKVVEV